MSTQPPPIAQIIQQGGSGDGTSPAPNDMGAVLRKAMESLQTTPFGPTPQPGGGIDPSIHPVIAKAISTLAQMAGAFGWSGMTGQERTERTQLEQQKAETMARLSQAGVAQEQTAAWREEQANTAKQRAASYEEDVKNKKERAQTQADIAQSRVDVQRDMVNVRKALGEGRLDVAHQQLTQRADQFEKMLKIRIAQVGVEQARNEIMEQGVAIKQGFLGVAQTALSQKGTVEGGQMAEKLTDFQLEHPWLTQLFGLPDVPSLVNQSRGAQIPGVSPGGTPATGTTAPLPSPALPQSPRAVTPKAVTPKATTPKSSGGAVQYHYDSQGNRVASPTPAAP